MGVNMTHAERLAEFVGLRELRSSQHRSGDRHDQGAPRGAGCFDGVAVRGPVAVGSISDLVFLLGRETSAEEVNAALREEAASERYREVLGVTEDPLVSSDIVGDPRASVVQLDMTRVVGGNLAKVMCWYDNEWGFTNQMVREALQDLGLKEAPPALTTS